MKIVSFDVGIKNLAYCVFSCDSTEKPASGIKIVDWNVIDLIGVPAGTTPSSKKCTATQKNQKVCGRKGKYEKGEHIFCDKHAQNCGFFLPTKQCSPAHLKKLKLVELQQLAADNKIIVDGGEPPKRSQLIEKILSFYEKRTLVLLKETKKRADEYTLIQIGERIKQCLDGIASMREVTHVLIENQISTVASRMSIIQGMLTQYFIMRHPETLGSPLTVEFVSSRNKLKYFADKTAVTATTTSSQKYRQHKMDSVKYTQALLEKFPEFSQWSAVLHTAKKDDLADCFLQGMWYLHHHEII